MTTHRAPESLAAPTRPVTAALLLSVLAGAGWIAGMIYTMADWTL
ncbi:morphogenic membrane protein MmpA [Streptomyces griseoviridis]|uniref:Uncharacterized protein n=1 Tax=Streptomyces hintoniae TaxID=3075521 RepID=A0ABU2UHW9_9ACTN|nr:MULTISPECIES: hypothetical protein [Streptomyces]MDT0472753.1 hypothetical protein [Streptomyces sp. DSM 41014]